MCANKVKENKYDFTPLSIFIQKIQGVWNLHLSTPHWYRFVKWEMNRSTQMPLWSEADTDIHPCLQCHIGLL